MKLEEKIALLRKRNSWSQEEFAFRLGVSRQAVSKWEMGASMPDLDNVLKMSELFACSTDYLLKDETTASAAEEMTAEKPECVKRVSDETCESYLALVQKTSWRIALGVALCILSPIAMFVLLGCAERGVLISEDVASGVGIAVVLIFVACGVILFIGSGIPLSKYEYLEKDEIEISERLEMWVREKAARENRGFIAAIAVGVALCILSAVPLILVGAFSQEDGAELFALAGLFPVVAIGVFLFVRFGMIHSGNEKLLQEGEIAVTKKRGNKQASVFAEIYWCFVTAGYLIVSFVTMDWHKTWLIWPVAGILFAVLDSLVRVINKAKKK